MPETIDWPPHRRSRRRGLILLLVVAGVLLLGGGTALSYYVDALWFDSLGYGAVFWKTLNLQATVFSTFTLATFVILYGSFVALKPPRLGELTGFPILINGQPIKLPVEPVLRLIAIVASLLIAFATGAGMMAQWSSLALWWYARGDALPGAAAGVVDPIFGRPLPFYLFTLPAWQLLYGWVMTLAGIVAGIAPAALCDVAGGVLGWYATRFSDKPNELVRERRFITHNIEMTRVAYALNRIAQRPFPAETPVEAADAPNNQDTIQNIRLWDWRALQDTLRQLQEIRTYYDFPDIDIDRYEIDGSTRQMMLAARELNVDKLPESSRNWINEKLIYTHGYGVTMNPVNGFTPEGLPTLILSNMPVQSTIPALKVTRPEIYFGELTTTDVYVRTRQKEFNYPQGETNSLTSYEGTGGIVIGGFFRRLLIALDRGDLAKLPFSDDVTAGSRLLMRRGIRERVQALAPFLTYDPDPYIVLGDDGRLSWIMDGFTTSNNYPYSSHYDL